jgi:hypothetical protein
MGRMPWMLMLLGVISGQCRSAEGLTAYDCSNRSNIVESYSLLEPDACTMSDRNGEIKTVVYREILQMKQDGIIPIFRCQVIETIVSQYCGHWSLAGVTRYIWFREPKALEAWKCRQARTHGKVIINSRTIQATIGATVLHAVLLNGGLDDSSNCEAGVISFSDGKTMSSQAAQGLYEITLREELAKMNKLTRSITLSSGVQAQVSDKSLVDSLEGTEV